jgi:predicted alpha/beta-hydrolase family hydrolase
MSLRELRIPVSERLGDVTALLLRPRGARALLAFAHGAGADMHHAFMQAAAEALSDRGIATLRYQFPYSEAGRRAPDHRKSLLATVRAAVAAAGKQARGLPLLAGGKSMGGRMTSLAAAEGDLDAVRGIAFFGFPLHAGGKPSNERGAPLRRVAQPLLFLQGSRDRLADLALLEPLVRGLPAPTRLHVVQDADHSFHVPKRSGRTDAEVIDELARVTATWVEGLKL